MSFSVLKSLVLATVLAAGVRVVHAAYLEWQVAPAMSVGQGKSESTYGEVEWSAGEEALEHGASAMPLRSGDVYFAEVLDYALAESGPTDRGRVNVAAALHVVPKSYLAVWHMALPVPEPTGATLVALAAGLLSLRRRKRGEA